MFGRENIKNPKSCILTTGTYLATDNLTYPMRIIYSKIINQSTQNEIIS